MSSVLKLSDKQWERIQQLATDINMVFKVTKRRRRVTDLANGFATYFLIKGDTKKSKLIGSHASQKADGSGAFLGSDRSDQG